jgi:DNA-binding SARP family transcriptional activator
MAWRDHHREVYSMLPAPPLGHSAAGASTALATRSADGLRLQLFGWFSVCRGGRVLTAAQVGSRKARRLLALLAVQRNQPVTIDRITEALWATGPPLRPERNVATMVSRLRAVLGADVVVGGRIGYRLNEAVRVDLHEAAAFVADAEARLANEPSSSLACARRGLDLLVSGDVLADDADWPWAEAARTWQDHLLRRARHAAAESALRMAYVHGARAWAQEARAADPLDEVAVRILMRAHHALAEPAQALLAYEHLRRVLASELGVQPARATRDLHLAILRAA